jgi:alanyl-tRNA synthetase
VLVGTLRDPPSVLLAASSDSGLDAGKTLQAALSEAGGRGGGTSRMAQGSVATAAALDQVLAKL